MLFSNSVLSFVRFSLAEFLAQFLARLQIEFVLLIWPSENGTDRLDFFRGETQLGLCRLLKLKL